MAQYEAICQVTILLQANFNELFLEFLLPTITISKVLLRERTFVNPLANSGHLIGI
jgi:hypothetical protein